MVQAPSVRAAPATLFSALISIIESSSSVERPYQAMSFALASHVAARVFGHDVHREDAGDPELATVNRIKSVFIT